MTEREQCEAVLFTSQRREIASLLGEEPDDIWISRKGMAQVGSFYKFVIPEAIASALLQLAQERDHFRAALEKYGRHLDTCGRAHYQGSVPCHCGLEEALNPPAAPEPAAAPPGAPGG